ncbi:MAG TPA: response regulator, partial [bacterium]|nr:response regulator [bacterium]
TKEQGRGTGLGLATIYGAVKQNNGFINIISEVGKGTEFDIYLPRHLTECESAEEKNCKTLQSLSTGEETILLVEDEPAILKAVSKLLQKLGYTLLSANNPVEAIKIAKNFKRNIHLLITDIVMPEMNGRVLAKELNSIYPDIKTIFMSGYTDDIIKPEDLENQKIRFIQKPFNLNDLSNEVREAFEK